MTATTPSETNGAREEFSERRVVVTGANSGIGASLVTKLADRGAVVFGLDIRLGTGDSRVTYIQTDVTDEKSMKQAFTEVHSAVGGIDVLCNNAGIGSTANPLNCSAAEWDRVFAVNVKGVLLGVQQALPAMLDQGHGVIVNTASVAGMIGLVDRTAYCASKGAVIALTRQIAIQYVKQGIRCNCVCPGTVDSPWVERLVADSNDPNYRESLVSRQPMGRLATPDEVAEAILYLGSDATAFMTGSALVLDGGITAA